MQGRLILEVLDRFGRVRERVRVDSFPFVVGRAYRCDLILDDRFVSPEHLRLDRDENGAVIAEDLGSTNGVLHLPSLNRVSRTAVDPDTRLRVGTTVLRFRSSESPVEPAHSYEPAPSLFAPFVRTNARCVITFCAAVVLLVAAEYLGSFEPFRSGEILVTVATTLGLLVGWAGLWAVATRFLSPRSDLLRHAAVAAVGLVALTAFLEGMEYFAFAFNVRLLHEVLWWAGIAVLVAVVLHAHVRFFAVAPPRRVALGATLASLTFVGLSLVVSIGSRWQRDSWSVQLPYDGFLKPPAVRLVGARSVDQFFERAGRLKEEVDRLAEERR